ncbi:cysteine dioxygenase family protein [Halomonas sp. BC04]|uniref:cysteine dioxygenase family protein n=1 Tax=Halomonas sp. BC04 TaxID=1403540 RepID=UPI0003ED7C83|nr:cysteine dioxygenase family protein [Halomonas sp. BC04]EWH01394.1 hypothetical protein Q427_14385 [Halomonas sp. BC04]
MEHAKTMRQQAVNDTLGRVRQVLDQQGLSRHALEEVLIELKQLAGCREFWSADDFPPPSEGERQARYLIDQQDDQTIALYLNVMRPGKRIPPHNHTTWACIAAIEGEESNTLYRRLDDGLIAGRATLKVDREIIIGPGQGVAMMPDDIHSVLIEGDTPIRHLHLYGRALETLTERITFDVDAGTCRRMDIGVKTRQSGAR